jgi:DNA-directed RNA polymerase subunit RPC12/RpoP
MEVRSGVSLVKCLRCESELNGEFIELEMRGDYVIECRCGSHQFFYGCVGTIGWYGLQYIARL